MMVAPLSVVTMCLGKLQPAFGHMHSGDEQRTHAILRCAQNALSKVSRFTIERQKNDLVTRPDSMRLNRGSHQVF